MATARCLALCAALVCLAAVASAASTPPGPTLAAIGPAKLSVNVTSFVVAGKTVPNSPLCTNQSLYSACLVRVSHETQDAVNIRYAVRAGLPVNESAFVQLRFCHSNFSKVDRPWRKTYPIIAQDKQCLTVIGTGLPPAAGNFTWAVPGTAPTTSGFVRAYVYCNSTGKPTPCAYGNSAGFFQLQREESNPPEMRYSVVGLSFLGPLILVLFFTYEKTAGKL